MKKHIKWLLNEIDLWVKEDVIQPEQGVALKNRYPAPAEGTAWGRIIFFSIGAILFGLGVILIFAYNWEKMHKFVKLAVIFSALIGAHATGCWLKRPESKYRAAGEGLHLLGTMLFGAGIWLIAQIYHIAEHYPNAFLIWGIGALALAWSLPSIPQALAAAILFVLWNCAEAFDFKDPHLVSPFLILGGIMPLAWLRRSRVLIFLFICTGGHRHVGMGHLAGGQKKAATRQHPELRILRGNGHIEHYDSQHPEPATLARMVQHGGVQYVVPLSMHRDDYQRLS